MGTFAQNILPNSTGLDLGNTTQRWDIFGRNSDWTGPITGNLKVANAVRYADQFPGSDFSAQVTAAINDGPTSGVIVDARGFTTPQTCASNPFSGISKPVMLLLPAQQITIKVKWILAANDIRLIGFDRTTTRIMADATFPTSNAMIEMGNNAGLFFGIRLENLYIDAQNITGSTCVLARGINERCGLSGVLLANYKTNGFKSDGSTQNTANFTLSDIECSVTDVGGSGDGILLVNTVSASIDRVTVVSNVQNTTAAGINNSTNSISNNINNVHVESHNDGILVSGGSASVVQLDVQNGVVNGLRIPAGSTASVVTAMYMASNANSAGSPTIKNELTGNSIGSANPPTPSGMVPYYSWVINSGETWMDNNGANFFNSANGLGNTRRLATFTGQMTTKGQSARFVNTDAGGHTWDIGELFSTGVLSIRDMTAANTAAWQFQLTGSAVNANSTLTQANTAARTYTFPDATGTIWEKIAVVNSTGLNAAVGTTTLYAVPATGAAQYRLSWNAKVTTVAGVSSTLGALTIVYTDPDGIAQTITAGAQVSAGTIATTSTGNTTTTVLLGLPILLNCQNSSNITYAMAYASNAANAMQYNLHISLDFAS